MSLASSSAHPKVGLILTGGGARAAYQVGVLQAIAAMLPKGSRNPFPVICGTSAGAINAASLAGSARSFHEGVDGLVSVWENAHVSQVYRSDPIGVLGNSARWLASLLFGGLGKYSAVSLLDNSPFTQLLQHNVPLHAIQKNIQSGALYALGITAWGYTSSQSVTFYQGVDAISPWKRSSRLGIASRIGIEHLVASSAIPFLFPAIKLNREYFGDGSMRQYAPISPALHLGAERVMVIGVRKADDTPPDRIKVEGYPPPAQIAGHVMGSIFLDNLDVDLERLQRMNNTIQLVPEDRLHCNDSPLRRVESLLISPSREISEMAEQHAHSLPRTIRLFYRAVGAMNRDGSALLSYLLFEKSFCRELIALGYQDTMPRSKEILQFLGFDTTD